MASLLFEDWDQGQKSDLLGIGDDTKVLRLPAEDVERTAALGALYKGVAEQRKAERETETRPIWSLLNPIGTERVGEQSMTVPRGDFKPLRTERYGEHSVWLPPGTQPVTEERHEGIKEASLRLNEELGNVTPAGAVAPGPRVAASARKLRTSGVPEPRVRVEAPVIGEDGGISLGGETVGRVKYEHGDQATRIADIEIFPSFRNQGIGSTAIQQIQEEAAARGNPVVLSTDAFRGKEAQANQRRLYERLGFVPNRGPDAVAERIGKRRVAEELVWRKPEEPQP